MADIAEKKYCYMFHDNVPKMRSVDFKVLYQNENTSCYLLFVFIVNMRDL